MYSKKHIWNVSYPIVLGLLAQNIINVTDTAFLGHIGEVELGASAMGGLYYICLFTIAFGFSNGAQIIIGRRNGEQNLFSIGHVVIQGTIFLLSLAFVLYAFSKYLGGMVMHAFISSDAIWEATMRFLDWRIFGFFFSAFNIMFRAFFIGITQTKALIINSIFMATANIFLDYGLIFGKFGMPETGIEGAAIASVIAEAVSSVFFIIHFFTVINLKKYGFTHVLPINFTLLKQVLEISVYMMLQYFISMGTYFMFFIVTERMGQHNLAIANIVRSIYIVMFIPMNALSVTANTLVSNIIGEGKITQVVPLIRRISGMSFGIMVVCVAALCIFAKQVLSVYTDDISLVSGSIPSIYVTSVALLFSSVSSVIFNGVSGTGNTRAAFLLEMVVLVLYTAYVYLTGITLKMPIHICFGAEIVYFGGMLIGSSLYLHLADWQNKRV